MKIDQIHRNNNNKTQPLPAKPIRYFPDDILIYVPVFELVLVPARQVEGGGAEEHDHRLNDAGVEDVEGASSSPSDCAHLQVPVR